MSLGEKFLNKLKKDRGHFREFDVDGPVRGCTIASRQEWVKYPETGAAIQNDKFINEQVKDYMERERCGTNSRE